MAGNEEEAASSDAFISVLSIASIGDLIVEAADDKRAEVFLYRTDTATLRQNSAYFDRLLDPEKFGEGADVARQLKALRKRYPEVTEAPDEQLPRVRVSDIGRISKVNSIKQLFGDLLKVLHGQDLVVGQSIPGAHAMPLPNVANLAVIADRFDALPCVSNYIRRKRILEAIDGRSKNKSLKSTEERIRQKLMVGVLLDYAPWVLPSSQGLIIGGSVRWRSDAPEDLDLPLWWDLPRGLEDELITRRDYVLDALQSIPLHFLSLYSSQTQQCRLGYDTSWACDAFQLGKMLKFFKKNHLVKLAPTLTGQEEADPYTEDIERLVDILKSCPADRMDSLHTRCDLRTRLIPLIDSLEVYLRSGTNGVGICGDCWLMAREKYAWSGAKQPLSWSGPVPRLPGPLTRKPMNNDACLQSHAKVRDMFMSVSRDWTPSGEKAEGVRFGTTTPFLKYD